MKFAPGDAVRLRIGGPTMIVQHEVDELLLCSWVDPSGRECRQTLSPRQLIPEERRELLVVRALKRLARRWSVRATF